MLTMVDGLIMGNMQYTSMIRIEKVCVNLMMLMIF